MSHIITNQDDIKNISNIFDDFCRKSYSKESIDDALYSLVPCNGFHFIDWEVSDSVKAAASFNATRERIFISPPLLKEELNKMVQKYQTVDSSISSSELFNYLVFWGFFHEIEHVFQYLIGMEYMEKPNDIIQNVYYVLYTLAKGYIYPFLDEKITNRLKYRFNHVDSTLERNANLEAFDLLIQLANHQGNAKIQSFFEAVNAYYTGLGYTLFSNGVVEKDFSKKYFLDKDYSQIPVEERIRYGFPVDFKTKKKIMKAHYFWRS